VKRFVGKVEYQDGRCSSRMPAAAGCGWKKRHSGHAEWGTNLEEGGHPRRIRSLRGFTDYPGGARLSGRVSVLRGGWEARKTKTRAGREASQGIAAALWRGRICICAATRRTGQPQALGRECFPWHRHRVESLLAMH
jgi:hypothetical protein